MLDNRVCAFPYTNARGQLILTFHNGISGVMRMLLSLADSRRPAATLNPGSEGEFDAGVCG